MIMRNILLIKNFNNLTTVKFPARLIQANLGSKSNITSFVKETDLNKNELNEQSKRVKAISAKGLTKDLLNQFIILNGAKYFPLAIFKGYLVLIAVKEYIKYFSGTTIINLYISYRQNPQSRNLNIDVTLKHSLSGSVKLTKNADPDKYKYSGCNIGFDSRLELSFADGS